MDLKLSNSLTRKKEIFTSQNKNKISLYVCGPTVYDRVHIGNCRAIIIFDLLYRILSYIYGKDNVVYVRNITDVDDKINHAAKEKSVNIADFTAQTINYFHQDIEKLNCLKPNFEPKATLHILQMQEMISQLIKNGNAYVAQSHVLFDVGTYQKYGKLSGRSQDEMIAGARVEVAPYKKNPADFVLWKPSKNDEPGWQSQWGFGRPGWHIECSAMSTYYLGSNFDIHGGGADLQFPHHENEIAQSCCATKGSNYAKYWVHNGFLTVNGEKMSKSLGNFITAHDLLEEKKINGQIIRLALIGTHYKKPLDWSDKLLNDAKKTIDDLYKAIEDFDTNLVNQDNISSDFVASLLDDLNTPLAITILRDLAKKINKMPVEDVSRIKLQSQLYNSCQLIGIMNESYGLYMQSKNISAKNEDLEAYILQMIEARNNARQNKDWSLADKIREELIAKNIIISDNKDGTTSWSFQ